MVASDLLVLVGGAALNLAVAGLFWRGRGQGPFNWVAAVLFASNGVAPLARAGYVAGGPDWLLFTLGHLLDVPSIAALILLPLLFPNRRLGPRGMQAAFAAVGVFVVASWAVRLVANDLFQPHQPLYTILAVAPLTLGTILGLVLFTDSYLHAGSRVQREGARLLLAAYVFKGTVVLLREYRGPEWFGELTALRGAPLTPFLAFALWVALLTPIAVMLLSTARGAREGRPAAALGAEWRRHAVVPLFIGLGAVVWYMNEPIPFVLIETFELEYLLARPILFAYGILQYQVLDVDLRRHRAGLSAAVLTAMAVVLVSSQKFLETHLRDAAMATGLAVIGVLAMGAMLAWPLVQRIAASPEERGRELYRAVLEDAIVAEREGRGGSVGGLHALRAQLGISEREHALEEFVARNALGGSAPSVVAGQRFLGRYGVERVLGSGGHGQAFLARDESLDRPVVLKVTRLPGGEARQRFLHEARVLARLQHPNILSIHDVEEVGGHCILVLQYAEGGSLAQRLAQGPLPAAEACRVVGEVLAGLEAAHEQGIVHRDVKPANILFAAGGRVKLADFGVASVGEEGSGTLSGLAGNPGSVRYMSPEQASDRPVDARSDVYAAGAVLYECLAGRPYLDFAARSEFDARLAVVQEHPRLPIRGVSKGLNALLRAALDKDPARRPATAAEMGARLVAEAPPKA